MSEPVGVYKRHMTQTHRETNSNISWLKPQQVEHLRDAAHSGRHGARDEAIVTLLYDTGLRRAELAAVDRDMVDLEAGELRIPGEIQKDYPTEQSPRPATFELDKSRGLRTERALRAYLNNRRDVDALFPSQKSDRMTGKAVNDVVKRLAVLAGVEPHTYAGRGEAADVTAHTLRHSVAWRMLRGEDGHTLYDVRNRLRHATITTTERKYDHFKKI